VAGVVQLLSRGDNRPTALAVGPMTLVPLEALPTYLLQSRGPAVAIHINMMQDSTMLRTIHTATRATVNDPADRGRPHTPSS
jgi:hypothetical protein